MEAIDSCTERGKKEGRNSSTILKGGSVELRQVILKEAISLITRKKRKGRST